MAKAPHVGRRADPRRLRSNPRGGDHAGRKSVLELVPPARIVDKHFYSPFAEPELHRLLQDCGVDAVVISGGETGGCVLAAVLDAVDLGYRVVVASDAVCSVSDEAHDNLIRLFSEGLNNRSRWPRPRSFWRPGLNPSQT
jgi:nicotinamidase-related amidase